MGATAFFPEYDETFGMNKKENYIQFTEKIFNYPEGEFVIDNKIEGDQTVDKKGAARLAILKSNLYQDLIINLVNGIAMEWFDTLWEV